MSYCARNRVSIRFNLRDPEQWILPSDNTIPAGHKEVHTRILQYTLQSDHILYVGSHVYRLGRIHVAKQDWENIIRIQGLGYLGDPAESGD